MVEGDRYNQHDAGNHLARELRNTDDLETAGENRQDPHPHRSAKQPADSAADRGAPDHRRGDGFKLQASPEACLSQRDPGCEHDPGDGRKKAAHRIGENLVTGDRNPR